MLAAAQHCGQREMIAVGEGDDEINMCDSPIEIRSPDPFIFVLHG